MNQPECLITGVVFLDQHQERWIKGDLHLLYDVLIVNASGCEWQYCSRHPLDPDQKMVKCNAEFYEKGNQIVFPLSVAEFNTVANKYLNDQMGTKNIIVFGSDSTH